MNVYESVTNRAVKGVGWMIFWRLGTRFLGFLSISVLARILLPADFGLVALAYAFAKAIDSTSNFSVDYILLREPCVNDDLYSTGFTLSLIRSFFTAIIISCFAHLFSTFFQDARLELILYCFALGLIFEGCENIKVIEFRKTLRFDKDFMLLAVPRLIGVIVSIGLAIALRSYWAMVISILAAKVSRTTLSYILHPFRPRLTLVARKPLLGFSVWMWATSIANFVRDRADAFVVGRMTNTASLGLFSAAYEIAILPITEIIQPIGRVLFSGISAAHHSGMEVGIAASRSIGAVTFLLLPAAIGISLTAAPLIYLTLGSAWITGYPLVQIIAPWAVCIILSSIGSTSLVVLGTPRVVTFATTGLAVLRPIALVFGLTGGGLRGVAWGIAFCYLVEGALYVIALTRLTSFRLWPVLRDLWRSLASVAVMIAVVVGLGLGWSLPPASTSAAFSQLLLGTLVGVATYTGCVFTLWSFCGYPEGPEALIFTLALPRLRAAARTIRAMGTSTWSGIKRVRPRNPIAN
jgi:lipopolysaccharide exporter